MNDYAKGLDPLPGGEAPRPSENPGNFSEQQAAEFTVIQLQRELDEARAEVELLRARADRAERELREFQNGLTGALNDHGVPAMPSWREAIDYLAMRTPMRLRR